MKADFETDEEYALRIARKVILHSYIYYYLNDNVITDSEFDRLSNELVRVKEDMKDHRLYEIVKDFTGETGMHLIRKDLDEYHTYWVSYAMWALRDRDEHERNTSNN